MWVTIDATSGEGQLVAVPDERVAELKRLGLPLKQVVRHEEVEQMLRANQLAEDAVIAHIVAYATDPANWQRFYQQNEPWSPTEQVLKRFQMLVDPVKLREVELEIDRTNAARIAQEAGEDALNPQFRQPVQPRKMKKVVMPVDIDGLGNFELREVEVPA